MSYFKADSRPDWEQRNRRSDKPKESDEAYAAFIIYRDLPVDDRSLETVSKKCRKSTSLIGRWSRLWGWDERIASWQRAERQRIDDAQAKEFDKLRLAQRKSRQDTLKLLQGLLAKTVQAATKTKEGEEAAPLSPNDLHRITRAAATIMEQSRREMNDMPDERRVLSGPNGGPIQTDSTVRAAGVDDMASLFRSLDEWKKQRASVSREIPLDQRGDEYEYEDVE